VNVLRLRDLFISAPAGAAGAGAAAFEARVTAPSAPAGRASDLAVICSEDDARAVAVAAAGLTARRRRAACGVACVWTPSASPPADGRPPSSSAARRLAASLAARGLEARACGRGVTVALPVAAAEAVAGTQRAIAAAGAAPVVVVLGGPRDAALDALLAEQRRVAVLTSGGEQLTALALAGLSGVAEMSVAETLSLGPAARAAAVAGVAMAPALRRALTAAMDRLDEAVPGPGGDGVPVPR
jgi:hypothetical protein